MRLPRLPDFSADSPDLPLWPPLLATRGPGGLSTLHAHHAMHFALACRGELRVRAGRTGSWTSCAGVLTPADLPHAIDARGTEVLLVFLDPESEVGRSLAAPLHGALPLQLLGAQPDQRPRAIHPSVRKLLRLLRKSAVVDGSLEGLAGAVGLSPGRLMHVFTESMGIPLRPYVAWLKLQRAAAAIASGAPLAVAAHAAGFADASHMTRTFRRMLGAPPSELRPDAPST